MASGDRVHTKPILVAGIERDQHKFKFKRYKPGLYDLHIVFHISTEALSFTFMNIYQYLILHKVRRKLYSESLEKILKKKVIEWKLYGPLLEIE
jgi:hypothetical protein